MSKDILIKDLKDCIDNKTPVDYFNKLTDVLSYLCDKVEKLENEVSIARTVMALAIKWDSRIALSMIESEIKCLRKNNHDFYKPQIDELKKAYKEDIVTQSYETFCAFWQDVIGVHPFLDYED